MMINKSNEIWIIADVSSWTLFTKQNFTARSRKISKPRDSSLYFFQSLWHLIGTSAAALPRSLSNFRLIRISQNSISQLRDFTRFGGKTPYRLVNRNPALQAYYHSWLRCSHFTVYQSNQTTPFNIASIRLSQSYPQGLIYFHWCH